MNKNHFASLWSNVHKMGAQIREYEHMSIQRSAFDFDAELNIGIEINLDQLETSGGLLSIHGRQVLLYIPDQGSRIHEVLEDPSQGKKFHVADCRTLDDMRKKGRFERYSVTNNLSGVFAVSGVDMARRTVDGEAALKVCKNCLRHLNYKGYKAGAEKGKIFRNFTIEQFFESYSTLFKRYPSEWTNRESGYAEDWAEVSARARASANWTCQQCHVRLDEHRGLLHTHHRDGNKRNNASANLAVLCIDCHRKQPLHETMFISRSDMATVQRLRREQRVNPVRGDWSEVLERIDTAYIGVAQLFQAKHTELPEVGFGISAVGQPAILTAELAWPKKKYAVVDDESELNKIRNVGWTGRTIADILNDYK